MGGKGDPRQGSDPKAAALVTLGINIGNKNLRSLPRFLLGIHYTNLAMLQLQLQLMNIRIWLWFSHQINKT